MTMKDQLPIELQYPATMCDHEDTCLDTGYSTPVPELDDHRHQSFSVQRTRSREAAIDTLHGLAGQNALDWELSYVNNGRLQIMTRDCEEAVVDEDLADVSPVQGRTAPDRSRRGTFATIDPRSVSPPNSVKAFAEARRHEDFDLRRTTSSATRRSHRSLRSRRYTNDNDVKSFAGSTKSVEGDVCFPMHKSTSTDILQIDFDYLEEFITDARVQTAPKSLPQQQVFHDLRPHNPVRIPAILTSGDIIEVPSDGSSSVREKTDQAGLDDGDSGEPQEHIDNNRFEFFTSLGESTIHAAEFGDLILPGEDIRTLFTIPKGDDGVWWLNMNNPTEEEIRTICRAFGVHPLTIEDIGTQEVREKIELFPSYYFACFRSFHLVEIDDGQEYEPFNIYVVVFREGTLSFSFSPNPHAGRVRQRITMLKDYLALSSDWICYALIDDIVDSFAPIIHSIEQETDTIEDQVFIARTDDMHAFLRKIGMVRRNVMGLMKLLGGKADVLRGFTKRCNANFKITPHMDIGLYLGDIQDHVVTMMTSLTHFERLLSRSHSNYLAQLSIDNITQGNHANKVLSKITVLASVLVPLNLVCGMFGMNVAVPWRAVESTVPFYGILGALLLFVLIALTFARRRRYI